MQGPASDSQSREHNKQWLTSQVNSVVEPMMLEVFNQRPDNHLDFMLKYLEQKFGERAMNGKPNELEALQAEAKQLEAQVMQMQSVKDQNDDKRSLNSEEHTDEDEDNDYMDILPETIAKARAKGPRSSVSAEAFGAFNKKGDFVPKVIAKSDQSIQQIRDKLSTVFMFDNLDDNEKKIVVDAMEVCTMAAGTKVIQEGDEGDCCYVVGNGTLACTKMLATSNSGSKESQFIKTYSPGDFFGELALLYNQKRGATIVANEESELYKLDRATFNHIVKDSACKKRDQYEEFLKQVELFQTIEPYERSKLSESFKSVTAKEGEFIIREGEDGTDLFFLQEGQCQATKVLQVGADPQVVMEYKVGDYFGERALLTKEPRAANVIAKTDCTLVKMDRHSFKRLLGPLEKLLRRNMSVYEKFALKKE